MSSVVIVDFVVFVAEQVDVLKVLVWLELPIQRGLRRKVISAAKIRDLDFETLTQRCPQHEFTPMVLLERSCPDNNIESLVYF